MFTANWDNTKYHTEVLEKPLITNMIRINLVSYSASGVALKFDIHGTVLHEITIPGTVVQLCVNSLKRPQIMVHNIVTNKF